MHVALHWQVGSMLLLQLCESMQINILFPFLVFMVEDFGYKGEKLGLYAGESVGAFRLSLFRFGKHRF
jgi:hypothetical protein